MQWRKSERERLLAARQALPAPTIVAWRHSIDTVLERAFPGLAGKTLALCWPIKNEYDARHLAHRLRGRGTRIALPVVVARGVPLVFREWHPGVELAEGALGIPYPVATPELAPDAVLLPMNGWDMKGYRLGYGGGFFDRTLAAMARKPVVIGVTYEIARLDTIHPQSWDIPVDYLVTERGLYRRDPEGLVFLGMPEPGGTGALASPVCYADERHFGGESS
ncbi:MAG: 5-formyltetrahydrofolate cyclo-ligase [Burkholderiales bacterium]